MLFGPKIKYFNELEINGEHMDDSDNEDFTNQNLDDDEENDDVVETNELDDYTEDDFVDDEEDPADNELDEDTDDTADDETEETTDYTEDEFVDDDENDEPTDTPEDNQEEPTDDTDQDAGDDNIEDYTEEDFVDDDEVPADDESEDTTDDTADDEPSGEDDTKSKDANTNAGNELMDMEKNLFSDLTPAQLAIKNNELLQNYITLYETINTIFDSINKIPKTYDNTRPLTFIADQLVELKDMVNYIITTTYITRTYVENMTYYKQSLVILTQLNTMLKALAKKSLK